MVAFQVSNFSSLFNSVLSREDFLGEGSSVSQQFQCLHGDVASCVGQPLFFFHVGEHFGDFESCDAEFGGEVFHFDVKFFSSDGSDAAVAKEFSKSAFGVFLACVPEFCFKVLQVCGDGIEKVHSECGMLTLQLVDGRFVKEHALHLFHRFDCVGVKVVQSGETRGADGAGSSQFFRDAVEPVGALSHNFHCAAKQQVQPHAGLSLVNQRCLGREGTEVKGSCAHDVQKVQATEPLEERMQQESVGETVFHESCVVCQSVRLLRRRSRAFGTSRQEVCVEVFYKSTE